MESLCLSNVILVLVLVSLLAYPEQCNNHSVQCHKTHIFSSSAKPTNSVGRSFITFHMSGLILVLL